MALIPWKDGPLTTLTGGAVGGAILAAILHFAPVIAGVFSRIGPTGGDANTLLGSTWASPAAIGSTTPAAGTFTALTAGNSNSAVNLSTGTAATTIGATAATAGAGLRVAATRIISGNASVTPVSFNGGANPTVTQLLDSGGLLAATGSGGTFTLPTWQGAAGIVQNLPGTPAVGDIIKITIVVGSALRVTLAAGTGGTITGNSTMSAGSSTYYCRLTNVAPGGETAVCYGAGATGVERDSSAYNSANLASATAFGEFGVTNASTLTADSKMVHDIASAGTGTFVVKLCSDGVTCGAGNVYLTCTAGANCATAAAGQIDACTVTKAAVTAGTTLTWSVGTACGTTDPGINVTAHLTTP